MCGHHSWRVLLVGNGSFTSEVGESIAPDCEVTIERSGALATERLARGFGLHAVVLTDTLLRPEIERLRDVLSFESTSCPVVFLQQTLVADLVNFGCCQGWFSAVWPLAPGWVTRLIESASRAHQARTERALRESFEEAVRPSTPWKMEDQVCWKTMLGAQAKDLANELGLKEKTVYGMRDRTRHRVGVSSIADLREIVTKPILPDWRAKR